MQMVNIDISGHRASSVESVEVDAFQFVIFLCEQAKRDFLAHHSIEGNKVRDLFVEDPYGYEFIDYIQCRQRLSKGLSELRFDTPSN
jgi:protein-tyrosine-phosphatase